jgi:16S rRNA (cytidine1402-2'-O)-methyltransferase
VIPGPSSVIAALAGSGFEADRFVFEGFLPRRGKDRRERLLAMASDERATVVFASPKRLAEDLDDMLSLMGPERRVAVARELTKLHEEIWVGRLDEALSRWSGEVKGEVTVVVAPADEGPAESIGDAVAEALAMVEEGVSRSEAARRAAGAAGVSRRAVYQALIEDQS